MQLAFPQALRPVIQCHSKGRHRVGLQGRDCCALHMGKSIRFSKIDDRAIFLLASTATVQGGTAAIL